VRPHGARELAQDEPGFYFAGMKSYGRAPTFLMLTGYEQVRSIAADIAGDREAAAGRTGAARDRRLQPRIAPRCQQLLRSAAHYRMLTPAALRMQSKAARQDRMRLRVRRTGVNGISLKAAPLSSRCAWGSSAACFRTSSCLHSCRVPDSGMALSGAQAGLLAAPAPPATC
jgi:hypothetical protein